MKVVAILGMHRSGTSALSGMLHTADYIAGHALLPPNAHNETGYYESRSITDLNDTILNALGNTWDDVRKISIPHADSNTAIAFTSRIVECFECEYSEANKAVLKDPRICRLLPLWMQAFASLGIKPLYVLALRPPREVAASLKRRDGMTIQKSALLYLAYLLDAEQNTRDKHRLIVTYSELLADPVSVLELLDTHSENDFHSREREQLGLVETFIDSNLRHKVEPCDWSRMQASEPMRLAEEFYEALSSRDEKFDATYFDDIRSRFDALLEDLEPWLSDAAYSEQLRREILAPSKESRKAANLYAHAAVYWRTNARDFCEEQKIVHAVTFDEKTCKLTFCLPHTNSPITDLRLDPIDRPAYCQIERVAIQNRLGEEIWNADLNQDLFSFTSGDMFNLGKKDIDSSCYDIVAARDDAYGTLSIPQSIIDKIGPEWILNVDLRFDLLVQAIEPICQNLLKFKEQSSTNNKIQFDTSNKEGLLSSSLQVPRKEIFIFGLDSSIKDSATKDIATLYELSGENTGNLVMSHAIEQLLGKPVRVFPWHDPLDGIDQKNAIGILALANQLGEHVDMGELASAFANLNVGLIGIGLGAQAADTDLDVDVPQGTLDWVRVIQAHSPTAAPNIAIRGEHTRRILEKYKLDANVVVLGCPSLYISSQKNLGAHIENRFSNSNGKLRIAVAAGHPGWPHLTPIESSLANIVSKTNGTYICQSPLEMVRIGRRECNMLPMEKRNYIRNYINPELTDAEFIEWSDMHAFSFFSPSAWLEYIRRFDFVIGTRINGVMLGIQAGIPSLCIAHDSRTEELCQTMMVPYVKAHTVANGIKYEDISRLFVFDGKQFDMNRTKLAIDYVDFLQSNGVDCADYMKSM